MRHVTHGILAAALVTSITGCSSMTVRADYDSQADFPSYSTFAVFERQGTSRRHPQMSELVDRRIGASIGAELEGKALRPTDSAKADVLVTFYTAVRQRVVIYHSGWYGWGRWGWPGGVARANSYPEGTLVIDVIDRRDRQLVWRGVGQGAFSTPNPSDAKVAKRVARVLRDFPPPR